MKREFFQKIESQKDSTKLELKSVVENLAYNSQGLIPAIAQDINTKEVLMMAWMNQKSLEQTLETGEVTYWSRSRNEFWVKGKTSGHTQSLKKLFVDCDGDTILCLVEQKGAACHTGRRNCFYLEVDQKESVVMVIGDEFSAVD